MYSSLIFLKHIYLLFFYYSIRFNAFLSTFSTAYLLHSSLHLLFFSSSLHFFSYLVFHFSSVITLNSRLSCKNIFSSLLPLWCFPPLSFPLTFLFPKASPILPSYPTHKPHSHHYLRHGWLGKTTHEQKKEKNCNIQGTKRKKKLNSRALFSSCIVFDILASRS